VGIDGQVGPPSDHLVQIAGEKHSHPGNASSRAIIARLTFLDRPAPSNLQDWSKV